MPLLPGEDLADFEARLKREADPIAECGNAKTWTPEQTRSFETTYIRPRRNGTSGYVDVLSGQTLPPGSARDWTQEQLLQFERSIGLARHSYF
jgi:hypothetical protein